MKQIRYILLFVLLAAFKQSPADAIVLHKKDATIWLSRQQINGEVKGFAAQFLIVHHNNKKIKVAVNNNRFSFIIDAAANNKIWAEYPERSLRSDTLTLTMGYKPVPVIKPVAVVKGNSVRLDALVTNTAGKANLKYQWQADAANPGKTKITNAANKTTIAQIQPVNGTYYFNLTVSWAGGATTYKTFVSRTAKGLRAFNIDADYPAWIDSAIVYQVTPNSFVKKGGLNAITAKLAEIRGLGINTVYLQPITRSGNGGQAYDVVDYCAVDERVGDAAQLKTLMAEARRLNMRVLLDLVPNHTSLKHPYAIDCATNGADSHYYSFYQHEYDDAPYSSFYHTDENKFVYYFWHGLVNLNYGNPEVQQWMIEVCKYWLREFDIDGYRFDAIWGVNSRAPQFAQRLRTELKSIKPDVLLLAEDKATDAGVYAKGFDAAYDWTADTAWISQWTWQTDHDDKKSFTVFNNADTACRAQLLNEALFEKSQLKRPVLRFIENNDLPRFISSHTPAQTKMAAGLLFALPGIPMLFNGQEIGRSFHPYSGRGIFTADKSIQALDSLGMVPYYKQLIQLRRQHPALQNGAIDQLSISGGKGLVAFHRYAGSQHFIVMMNLNSAAANAGIGTAQLNAGKPALATDVLTGAPYKFTTNELSVPLEGYGIKWLLLSN